MENIQLNDDAYNLQISQAYFINFYIRMST
jgi:hypothetical protein